MYIMHYSELTKSMESFNDVITIFNHISAIIIYNK